MGWTGRRGGTDRLGGTGRLPALMDALIDTGSNASLHRIETCLDISLRIYWFWGGGRTVFRN
ncbi:hypothetical protein Pla52n_38040 [Stieleria varia]|uniref:Uncharacterized protein n=1 Tax=Stieleria varia TaxID=2528005 RepID=A0A5C6ARY3_9BACT|nr:hypothetical protein Pla52n_38040 [Stieleria varia]